ncbi:MAG: NADH-quinone oxidoreductase subunit H [Eubacteriaceae bacterium]|jgi:formate hydrogenlyase subunit 4|nr:NADH-quinone oxidoreductase subunit H [Eubacteriaceae bacterium]
MTVMIISVVAYLILGPIVGGLLAGCDRKITAHMQSRVGPPIRQPFYDVFKLTEKEDITVNNVQDFYVLCFLIFTIVTGCLFFAGQSLLLVFFTLTTASTFLIVAAYSSNSPYAEAGAARELLQVMAYEPMVLLSAIGFYMATGSFDVSQIMTSETMPFFAVWGLFIGLVFIMTIKFRKSPFDLSMSEHAHQELVGGLKTEFSGKTLAMVEVAHWYENVMLLGLIFLFFANGTVAGYVIGVVVALLTYFLEIFIDNSFARMKWQAAINSAWIVAAALGAVNLFVLLLV